MSRRRVIPGRVRVHRPINPPHHGGDVAPDTASVAPSVDVYGRALANDPIYHQAVADASAASAADTSQLGSGIMSALIERGLVPDIESAAAKLGLSPDVVNFIKGHVDLARARSLAAQADASGVSTEAQLLRQHAQQMQNIKDSLAARGMVSSGATPFLTGQEATRYTGARFQADKALGDYLSGAYAAFAKNEQGRQGDLRSALENAYGRVLQNWDSTTPPGAGAPSPGAPVVPTSHPRRIPRRPVAQRPGVVGGLPHPGPVTL